jgi:hypothetical protein
MTRQDTFIMRDQVQNLVPSLMARKQACPGFRKLLAPFRMPLIGFGGMLLLIV